jgi:hypothetical protein
VINQSQSREWPVESYINPAANKKRGRGSLS